MAIFSDHPVAAGRTSSWSYPSRATLLNTILRHRNGDAHLIDGGGGRRPIPNGAVFNCLVRKGMRVVHNFAGIDQRWVINSFPQRASATCAATGSPPPPPPPPTPPPTPPPPPPPPPSRSVTTSKGASAQGRPDCTSAACRYVRVAFANFGPGSHTVICRASGEEGGFWTYTTSNPTTEVCYYGFPSRSVWVTVDGVTSNVVAW
jgi:hypothetical protein